MKTDQEKAYEWFLKRAVTMPGAKEMYKIAYDVKNIDGYRFSDGNFS